MPTQLLKFFNKFMRTIKVVDTFDCFLGFFSQHNNQIRADFEAVAFLIEIFSGRYE